MDGIQLIMCVAPVVQFYPLYGELFGDRVTDASKRTFSQANILSKTNLTPAIIPRGFSEATYTNADLFHQVWRLCIKTRSQLVHKILRLWPLH